MRRFTTKNTKVQKTQKGLLLFLLCAFCLFVVNRSSVNPKRRSRLRRSASEPCMRVSISHRLLSDIAVAIGIRAVTSLHGLVICLFTPPPCGSSIPHASARAHSLFSVTRPDHLNITVPTSAYPLAFPEALASWGIPPLCSIRLTPTRY
jgi:hypothetical protein